MSKKQMRLAALPLGGVGEIGRNMMVYECNDEYIVVDAGISFADPTMPGIDIVLPDTKFLRDHAKKIRGVFITHAHEDHIGAMGYLWDELEVPVHVSPFARCVLEDKIGQLGHKDDGRIVTVEEGEKYKVGCFEVEYVAVTHSIPEAFSLAIHTPHGTIVHTGDYKFDHNPALGKPANTKRLKEIGDAGVLAMFGDSTSIFNTEDAGSEGDLSPRLEEVLKNTKERLFFTTFASNTFRLIKMVEIAAKHGRKSCLMGRTAQKFSEHAKKLGYFPGSLTNHLVSVEEAAKLPRNKVMIFASGTQGESNAALPRLSQGMNIRGLKIIKGDTVLMSSKMIPGNERQILGVINRLISHGAIVLHEHNSDVHVSGHGGQKDMTQMYDLLRPQILVPVHGEEAHLVAQGEFGKKQGIKIVLQIRNGKKVVLAGVDKDGDSEKPHVMQSGFHHGINLVDGLNILDEDMWVIKERQKMSYDGVVVVSFAVSLESREIMIEPTITSRGLIDPKLQNYIIEEAEAKTAQVLSTVFADNRVDDNVRAEEVIRQTVGKVFRQQRGKKPQVIVQIVEV